MHTRITNTSPQVGSLAPLIGPHLTAAPAGFNVPAFTLVHTQKKQKKKTTSNIPYHWLIIFTHADLNLNTIIDKQHN